MSMMRREKSPETNDKDNHLSKKRRHKDVLRLGVFMAAFALYSVLATYFLGHACPINLLFGVPCPGCGLTRACLCLFRGDVYGAIAMHPLVFTLPVIFGCFIAAFFSEKFAYSKPLIVLSAVGVALFLGVYVYRMATVFPSAEPMAYNKRSLLFLLLHLLRSL